METFGFRADGGARNKPLHDCSNERAAEADECCEDFGRHVIGGEVSQMANVSRVMLIEHLDRGQDQGN